MNLVQSRRALLQLRPIFRQHSTCTEVRIPVPWGYIAGKWWGDQSKRPILGLHGWLDNCGTFDTLAPLLPGSPGLLAIDFPGHGLSSWYPPGFSYHLYDNPGLFKRLQTYFNWPKVSFLAHSMGSMYAFIFASFFPDDVDFLIGLDALKPFTDTPEAERKWQADQIVKCLKCENKPGKPKHFSYDDMVKMLCFSGKNSSVSPERAPLMLKRGIVQSKEHPDRYTFRHDPRLNNWNNLPRLAHDINMAYAAHIRCNFMNVRMMNSPEFEESRLFGEVMAVIKRSAKVCEAVEMPGIHHEHMNNPESALKQIVPFIEKYGGEFRDTAFQVQDIHHIEP